MDKQTKEQAALGSSLILTLILDEHQSQRFIRIAKDKGIRDGIIVLGRGTVASAVLNLLGIKSQKKEIISILLEREQSEEALDFFTRELQLDKPGHGIAYTSPVTVASQIADKVQDTLSATQGVEGESMFKKLTVVVNRGMAEDVMEIARRSGVRGGTIMHGRGTGLESTIKLFGMEIEPEKELVMILMPSNLVDKVVSDLSSELKMDLPGNGILFVESVVDVRGLFESHHNNKDA